MDILMNQVPKDFVLTEDDELVPALRDDHGKLVAAMKDIEGFWMPSPGYIPVGKSEREADVKKVVPTKDACQKFMAGYKDDELARAYAIDVVKFRCFRFYNNGRTQEEIYRILKKEAPIKYKERQLEDKWKKDDDAERKREEIRKARPSVFSLVLPTTPPPPRNARSKNGFRVLETSSQGTVFDLPPESWITEELVKFGARAAGDGKVRVPDLQGHLHPVFDRARWLKVDNKRYDALRQSMQLATKLLSLSGALMAVFLPELQHNPDRADVFATSQPFDDSLPTRPAVRDRMRRAMEFFERDLAPTLTWREGQDMILHPGWYGVNAPKDGSVTEVSDRYDWRYAWERDYQNGFKTRPVTIGLTTDFANIILLSEPDSERYLFATFYAGITMAHELCHFWFNQNPTTKPASGEPFLGNDLRMELGDSYISWLFGGFIPNLIQTKGQTDSEYGRFRQGVHWREALVVGSPNRCYDTHYSMSIEHIERIMSQNEWDKYGGRLKSDPAGVRKEMLHPKLPFQIGKVARIAKHAPLTSLRNFTFDSSGIDADAIDLHLTPFQYFDKNWNDQPDKTASSEPGSEESSSAPPDKSLEKEKQVLLGKLGKADEKISELSLKKARDLNRVREIEQQLRIVQILDPDSPLHSFGEGSLSAPFAGNFPANGAAPKKAWAEKDIPPALKSIWHQLNDAQREKYMKQLLLMNGLETVPSSDTSAAGPSGRNAKGKNTGGKRPEQRKSNGAEEKRSTAKDLGKR